tara:strand:- start:189 stop:356 length:168 start_codon:yes stop_codon:yes gene_type:complete
VFAGVLAAVAPPEIPLPPPADVIVEKIELLPAVDVPLPPLGDEEEGLPPAPTVMG